MKELSVEMFCNTTKKFSVCEMPTSSEKDGLSVQLSDILMETPVMAKGHLNCTVSLKNSIVCMQCFHVFEDKEDRSTHVCLRSGSNSVPEEKSESSKSVASHVIKEAQEEFEKEQCFPSQAKEPNMCVANRATKKHSLRQPSNHIDGELPYVCKICERKFAGVAHLATHMFVHTHKEPLACKICGRKFVRKGHLARHMCIHMTEESGLSKVHIKKPSEKESLDCYIEKVCENTVQNNPTEEQPIKTQQDVPAVKEQCAEDLPKNEHDVLKKEDCSTHLYVDSAANCDEKLEEENHSSSCVVSYATKEGWKKIKKEQCLSTQATESDVPVAKCAKKHPLEELSSHIYEKPPHVCKICQTKFAGVSHRATDMFVHTRKEPLVCKICGRTFVKKGCLARHMNIHMFEELGTSNMLVGKPLKNELLGNYTGQESENKTYKNFECISSHTWSNISKKRPIDELKEKNMTEELVRRERDISPVPYSKFIMKGYPLICGQKEFPAKEKYCERSTKQCFSGDITSQSFEGSGEDEIHTKEFADKQLLASSNSEKPHECKICCTNFSDMIDLSNHVLSHMLQESYECKMCSRRFSNMIDLSNHALTHVSEKQHKCRFCSMEFSTELDLTRHLSSATHDALHECKICSRKFLSMIDLSTHILSGCSENKLSNLHVH